MQLRVCGVGKLGGGARGQLRLARTVGGQHYPGREDAHRDVSFLGTIAHPDDAICRTKMHPPGVRPARDRYGRTFHNALKRKSDLAEGRFHALSRNSPLSRICTELTSE